MHKDDDHKNKCLCESGIIGVRTACALSLRENSPSGKHGILQFHSLLKTMKSLNYNMSYWIVEIRQLYKNDLVSNVRLFNDELLARRCGDLYREQAQNWKGQTKVAVAKLNLLSSLPSQITELL